MIAVSFESTLEPQEVVDPPLTDCHQLTRMFFIRKSKPLAVHLDLPSQVISHGLMAARAGCTGAPADRAAIVSARVAASTESRDRWIDRS